MYSIDFYSLDAVKSMLSVYRLSKQEKHQLWLETNLNFLPKQFPFHTYEQSTWFLTVKLENSEPACNKSYRLNSKNVICSQIFYEITLIYSILKWTFKWYSHCMSLCFFGLAGMILEILS